MDNVTFIDVTNENGDITQNVIIDRGNGNFTSMLKSTYDAQQSASTLPSNFSTPQAGA